jgi:O-Antigen ligase
MQTLCCAGAMRPLFVGSTLARRLHTWRLPRIRATELIALASLASLFFRNDHYPAVLQVGSATVYAQDLLLLAVVVAAATRWRDLGKRELLALLFLSLLLAFFAFAAARSPVGQPAVVAVAKIAEFLLAGFAALLIISSSRYVALATAVLATGTLVNALDGLVSLAQDGGPHALVTGRADALVGGNTYAAAAAATAIWCYARLSATSSALERRACAMGFVGAALALVAAKSFVSVACVAAVVTISPALPGRWIRNSAVVAAVLVGVLALGRFSDIKPLAGALPQPLVATVEGPVPSWNRLQGFGFTLDASPEPALRDEPAVSGSLVHRIAVAYLGVRLILERPWLGHGWLQTSDPTFLRSGPYDSIMLERYSHLNPTLFVSTFPTALHNAYIQVAAEAGIFAALALIVLLAYYLTGSFVQLWRRRRSTDWRTIAAVGWLVAMVLVLQTNAVFGGGIELSLTGGALALAARGGWPRLGARHAAIAAAAVAGLIAVTMLVVLPLREPGPPPEDARAKALDVRRGEEAFSVEHEFERVDAAVLTNGLVTVGADRGGLMLWPSGKRQLSVRISLGRGFRADRSEVSLTQRTANQVTALYRSRMRSSDGVLVSVVRGVPGVYVVSPERNAGGDQPVGVTIPDPHLLDLGNAAYRADSQLRFQSWSVAGSQPLLALPARPAAMALVMPFSATEAVPTTASGRTSRPGLFVVHPEGRNSVTFISVVPLGRTGGYLPRGGRFILGKPGTYRVARLTDNGWASTREREGATSHSRAYSAIPLELGGLAAMGLNEIAELAFWNCPGAETLSTPSPKDAREQLETPIYMPCYAFAGNSQEVIQLDR